MSSKPDDLEAVRSLVEALKTFDAVNQERIIRWAREKLGLPTTSSTVITPTPVVSSIEATIPQPAPLLVPQSQDIRSFMASKNPQTDAHFAAAVAYYYRFVAPAEQRKEAIEKNDLQEACRMVDRDRLRRPDQTLVNAHNAGLLDKAGRGAYSINAVGENLVAMALPRGTEKKPAKSKPKKANKKKNEKTRKARRT